MLCRVRMMHGWLQSGSGSGALRTPRNNRREWGVWASPLVGSRRDKDGPGGGGVAVPTGTVRTGAASKREGALHPAEGVRDDDVWRVLVASEANLCAFACEQVG